MKGFREQYIECNDAGYIGKGARQKITTNMLPFNPKIAKKFLENEVKFFETVACLRFGGRCNSANPRCRKLREVGFTAIEILIAICIVGLVATILVAKYVSK